MRVVLCRLAPPVTAHSIVSGTMRAAWREGVSGWHQAFQRGWRPTAASGHAMPVVCCACVRRGSSLLHDTFLKAGWQTCWVCAFHGLVLYPPWECEALRQSVLGSVLQHVARRAS